MYEYNVTYFICFRDLKTDNVLLDVSEGDDVCPALAITDFGCCLADKDNGLNLPYKTVDTDRGGNIALMAPEVKLVLISKYKTIISMVNLLLGRQCSTRYVWIYKLFKSRRLGSWSNGV